MVFGAEGGAAAAMAAIAEAIKASGAIVTVNPENFLRVLARVEKPLVVMAKGGVFKPNYQYLTSYKGMVFMTKSPAEMLLPGSVELIVAKQIWVPSF